MSPATCDINYSTKLYRFSLQLSLDKRSQAHDAEYDKRYQHRAYSQYQFCDTGLYLDCTDQDRRVIDVQITIQGYSQDALCPAVDIGDVATFWRNYSRMHEARNFGTRQRVTFLCIQSD